MLVGGFGFWDFHMHWVAKVEVSSMVSLVQRLLKAVAQLLSFDL